MDNIDLMVAIAKKYSGSGGSVESYKTTVNISDWTLNGDLYEKKITHGLNTRNISVTITDTNSKSVVEVFDRVDNNSILLKNDVAELLNVVVIKC